METHLARKTALLRGPESGWMLVLLREPDSVPRLEMQLGQESGQGSETQSGQERGQGLEMHLVQKMALVSARALGWMLALLRGPDSVPRLEMHSVQERVQGSEMR